MNKKGYLKDYKHRDKEKNHSHRQAKRKAERSIADAKKIYKGKLVLKKANYWGTLEDKIYFVEDVINHSYYSQPYLVLKEADDPSVTTEYPINNETQIIDDNYIIALRVKEVKEFSLETPKKKEDLIWAGEYGQDVTINVQRPDGLLSFIRQI